MNDPGIRRKQPFAAGFLTFGRAAVVIGVVMFLFFSFGTALGASGGGHGEAAPKGWVAEDTYRVMNFAVLAIVLFLILRKPLTQALNGRIQGIKDQLSELEAKKKEAEKKLADYNEKLARLDGEAERLVAEYIQQGNEAKARILAEAESAAAKMEDQARRNIEHEFKQAKQKLQQDVIEQALVKAEAIIKDKISATDQDKLVDEYLEKVVS
jgi:F-type H+-transporting ATPase subunit b